jgi:hypothetical protein
MKTDSQLQQDVMAELKWDPATRFAWSGSGVRHVVDKMTLAY